MTASAHTSTPQKITRVTSCGECPFFDADQDYCRETEKDTYLRSPPPDWCPLRKGGILVVLSSEAR